MIACTGPRPPILGSVGKVPTCSDRGRFPARRLFSPSRGHRIRAFFHSTLFFSYSCALSCAFLRSPKPHPICFQAIPHSLQKKPEVRWGQCSCESAFHPSPSQTLSYLRTRPVHPIRSNMVGYLADGTTWRGV